MKKHLAALLVAVMMAAGLVVASAGTASAQCSPSQYAGCFRTVTKVTATKRVPKGTRATICVTVSVAAGSGTPLGVVRVAIQKRRSTKVVRTDMDYTGGKTCLVTRKYSKKGRYSVTAVYMSPGGSVFYNSADKTRFKVTPR